MMEEMKNPELASYENIEIISKFLKNTKFNYKPEHVEAPKKYP